MFARAVRIRRNTKMNASVLKVLIVLTSHSQLGHTGRPTGYYLSEATHPYYKLSAAGYQVEFASPQGGKAPMDPGSRDLSDPENARFLADAALSRKLETTLSSSQVKSKDYSAIIYAGGHGTMWDFPQNRSLAKLASKIYEKGGVVAAVCHGPAALLEIRLSGGRRLIEGRELTSFTNDEESAAGLTREMPFALETELSARGAVFRKAGAWARNVVVSGRLVTGQNPASAAGVGEAVAELLNARRIP